MNLPRVIVPFQENVENIKISQNTLDAISQFNKIVNIRDNFNHKIISYNISCTFDITDFPEIESELKSPLNPLIYDVKLYFYTVDKKFSPVPITYKSKNPITSVDILNFIAKMYETELSDENVAFYKLYDSDYNYLCEGDKLGNVMKYCYFQSMEPYKDGFLVNIFG